MSYFSANIIQLIAEQRIEEAQSKGLFDDLPGKGRPLELEDDSNIPEELRMVYKILHNAGCLPPEIQERKEINRLVDLLEQCEDEQKRVAEMQKLRIMIERSRARFRHDIRIEQDNPYYDQILDRLTSLQKKKGSVRIKC